MADQLGLFSNPAKGWIGMVTLYGTKTLAAMDAGFGECDVGGFVLATAVGSELVGALPGTDADEVRAAICELVVQGSVFRNIAHDVSAVNPVHTAFLQPAGGE